MPDVRAVLLAGILALLFGAPGAASATPPPSAPASEDSLTAAAVAVTLRYGAAPKTPAPLPRDRWLGPDKALHVTASALWTLSTQYVLEEGADWSRPDALPVSIASGAAVGIAKEAYDASRLTNSASGRDLVANAVGIGLAVGIIVL